MDEKYVPTAEDESLARLIVDCAFQVHNKLGPGLLEAMYEHCFCYELKKRGVTYKTQEGKPLFYDGIQLPWFLRPDVLVENRIICELKSVLVLHPVHLAQVLTQLKLVNLHLGFLINFNVAVIKTGIRRVIR